MHRVIGKNDDVISEHSITVPAVFQTGRVDRLRVWT